MSDRLSEKIEYRTPCRLSDQLKVQFWCSFHSLRSFLILFGLVIVVLFIGNGGSIDKVVSDPLGFIIPLIFGLAVGLGFGPMIVISRWMLGKMPKEIQAELNNEGIRVIGENLNYEAKWASVIWVKEGRSAYLLRFKALWFRLPKRGFAPEQESSFRNLIHSVVPTSAFRLKQ